MFNCSYNHIVLERVPQKSCEFLHGALSWLNTSPSTALTFLAVFVTAGFTIDGAGLSNILQQRRQIPVSVGKIDKFLHSVAILLTQHFKFLSYSSSVKV